MMREPTLAEIGTHNASMVEEKSVRALLRLHSYVPK